MAGYIIEPGATTAGKTDMGAYTWREPTTLALRKQVQQALKDVGRYSGPADGAWGPNTIKGIQKSAAKVGYTGPIDGAVGVNTVRYSIDYAYKGSNWNSWYNTSSGRSNRMYYYPDRVWADFRKQLVKEDS
ncbi:peptidoglycan-binding domain-containing protein [Gulosibacter sediminis]|uniref:peptidoglycan-binding domain-containing protein n=1 Tax=Gulosibacter sediminis TaxID=1729695 RepID=UPI0024A7A4D9|nr:hypothetical protein [Gulosibacter sediminis]